jgi:hypothetical protein
MPNSTFDSGINLPGGWTVDNTAAFRRDTANNGSYPSPANSIKISGTPSAAHLFSPNVSVDPNATYMFKNFLNVQAINAGAEVGFYVDEYDANGNWISGQFKAAEKSVFVESLNFAYKPTSIRVSKASLQVYTTANSGISAYLDNARIFSLTATVVPPAQTNLMTNGTFDAGITGGWRTDALTSIVSDNQNNGSPNNVNNSVKMTSTTKDIHLFSPLIGVDLASTYNINSYINIKQLGTTAGSQIGYYIDEYDANGNWIAGQWKAGVTTVGAGFVGLQYKPSSLNVKQASLQIILTANSSALAYFDDVVWVKQ